MLPFMFNLLSDYQVQPNAQGYHLIAEAMKFAFAQRTYFGGVKTDQVAEIFNRLTRKEFAAEIRKLLNTDGTVNNASYYGALYSNPDDRGTTHVSILAPNGDAISATNTINDIFGAMFRSQSTGIIPNDEMDDFSKPSDVPNDAGVYPTPNNYPIPGNNPMSSMVPTIVVDRNGDVRMIAGAAGGPRIISGTFMVMFRHLYFNETLADAIAGTRIHHQISPMELLYEPTLDAGIVEELRNKYGHAVRNYGYMATATAITVKDGEVEAAFDFRRSGSSEVFSLQ
jgi:gamma-glutamyltranspeptidase / glutathione hydrolase / leukotriene-C4 hydrolase